ncbi:MAG: type II toxin-antitoxin system HicB family antitoxin [Candidatus Eremiobacterota bacterium]
MNNSYDLSDYHIQIINEDNRYIAYTEELSGCSAFGDSEEEARKALSVAYELWQEAARSINYPIPEPFKVMSGSKKEEDSLFAKVKQEINSLIEEAIGLMTIKIKLAGADFQDNKWEPKCIEHFLFPEEINNKKVDILILIFDGKKENTYNICIRILDNANPEEVMSDICYVLDGTPKDTDDKGFVLFADINKKIYPLEIDNLIFELNLKEAKILCEPKK